MKLATRLLKRNHELYKRYKLHERLSLCLIREENVLDEVNKGARNENNNI